jgi:hypothetical protein
MNALKIMVITLGAIVVLSLALYTYYGGFKTISFYVVDTGGELLAYEEMKGDYNQTKEVTDRVYYLLLNDLKIETYKGFGLYYDDPKTVETSKLRSDIGCIIEDVDSTKIELISQHLKVRTCPEGKYVITEFPNKGFISVIIGIIKVYPAFNDYVAANGYKDGPVMEIYDMPNKKIIYRKEIIK